MTCCYRTFGADRRGSAASCLAGFGFQAAVGIAGNEDGSKPYSHSAFSQQLRRRQGTIGLRDEAGQLVTVTGHQLRHARDPTNFSSGVPQHVVQNSSAMPALT
jgi:hypothetical protein